MARYTVSSHDGRESPHFLTAGATSDRVPPTRRRETFKDASLPAGSKPLPHWPLAVLPPPAKPEWLPPELLPPVAPPPPGLLVHHPKDPPPQQPPTQLASQLAKKPPSPGRLVEPSHERPPQNGCIASYGEPLQGDVA